MNDKEQVAQDKENERVVSLLAKLSQLEEFQLWRDLVCKPQIRILENALAQTDEISESELRAKVKHLNSLKYLFYQIFDDIRTNVEINK